MTIEFGLILPAGIDFGLRNINSRGSVNGRKNIFQGFLIALARWLANLKEKDERIRYNSLDSCVAN
tara:strand:+ start:1140 stop:1337 length:198 start_codon:yes stop_codon:yes gene_type:complete